MKLTFLLSAILILSVVSYDLNNCQNLPNDCQNWNLALPSGFQKLDKNCSNKVLKSFGQGGLCKCVVAKKKKNATIQVYRAFDTLPKQNNLTSLSHKADKFSGYWGLEPINNIKADDYRIKYAICNIWNKLTYKIRCELPDDSQVQIGFGQSVVSGQSELQGCKNKNECYRQSAQLQIVLDRDTTGKMEQAQNTTCVTLNFNEQFEKKKENRNHRHFLMRN